MRADSTPEREKNITFLISSHILGELSATKYGFIRNGQLIKEITARQLEQECRKSTEFQVSDVKETTQVLETQLNIKNFSLLNGSIVRIYDEIDITLITMEFFKSGNHHPQDTQPR